MQYRILLLISVFIGIISCNQKLGNNNDTVLARVYDVYLYESDIEGLVPENSKAKDSLAIIKSYINNWVRQKLLVHQAEKNLSQEQKDFSKQLEQYKNSLITYKYETYLIRQNLDTVVSNYDIEEYYEKHKSNFRLKNNIVKVEYLKLPKNSEYSKILKKILKKDKNSLRQSESDSLTLLCELHAEEHFLNNDQWINFDHLLKIIPITTYNQEAYLKNNKFIELKDDNFQYYVNVLDFSTKDEYSPLDLEKDNIRLLIMNERKRDLLNKMHEDIFDEALDKNEIEIF